MITTTIRTITKPTDAGLAPIQVETRSNPVSRLIRLLNEAIPKSVITSEIAKNMLIRVNRR